MAAKIVESGVYFVQNVSSGTVLDLDSGSDKDGTKAQGWRKRELDDVWVSAQLWIICKIDNDNVYTIQNAHSRTYLDLTDGSSASETKAIGYHPTNATSQHWVITRDLFKRAYTIVNKSAGTYLHLHKGSAENATTVDATTGPGKSADTSTEQLWHIVRA